MQRQAVARSLARREMQACALALFLWRRAAGSRRRLLRACGLRLRVDRRVAVRALLGWRVGVLMHMRTSAIESKHAIYLAAIGDQSFLEHMPQAAASP